MIGTDTIGRVIGQDVYDESGAKIGSASEVYLDDETGQPEWVTVRTGLFGTKESFVPIRDADLTDEGIRVHVDKARVKDAPKIDAEGHLSPEEERELYDYYGMDLGARTGRTDAGRADMTETAGTGQAGTAGMTGTGQAGTAGMTGTGQAGTAGMTDTGQAGTAGRRDAVDADEGRAVGRDTSGPTTDEAMTRSEERVNVDTRAEEVGRARLRKYVVTENVTETVPVSREEARVEREPITDANVGDAMEGPAISEAEHEVTLHAERPVVDKEAVPVERVRLDTETVTDQEQVNETVRKEQVDTDDPDRRR
jgi:uncharacterized protein (TIGR02271 family)